MARNITEIPSVTNSTDEDGPDAAVTSLQASLYQLNIIYYTIGAVGMLGNLFVLYVMLRSANMRAKITNWYIINQSAADLMGSVFLVLTSLFQEPNRKLDGVADYLYCYLWVTKWQMWSMFTASTYSLVIITIERYLSIVHAIWHKTSFTKTKAVVSIVSAWVFAIFYPATYMMTPVSVGNGYCALFSNYISAEAQSGVGIMNVFLMYIIPLVILILCYSRMIQVLQSRVQPHNPTQQPSGQASGQPIGQAHGGQMSRAKKNVIKTLATVSLGFVLCWTCNQVYFLMFTLGYPADFGSPFYHFTIVAIFCNCCINPIIYMVKYDSFRNSARALFPWLCKQRTDADGSTTSSRETRAQVKK